ncbi:MAG: DUF5678 domain-containing protein [Acidobacteriota bacterium]|nr:DUF5678 domain-containing protein [Acidobacteriota bacterium]
MQVSLEQFREIVRALPIEDFDKMREVINEEEKAKNAKEKTSNWQIERYKKARKWLDENGEKYMNQWVCLEGDKLVAHGEDGLEVHRRAKEAGIKIPFVHHIVPEIDWGGW